MELFPRTEFHFVTAQHGLELLTVSPTVPYRVTIDRGGEKGAQTFILEAAQDFPENKHGVRSEEPMVKATLVVPEDLVPAIQKLCLERRGELVSISYIGGHDEIAEARNEPKLVKMIKSSSGSASGEEAGGRNSAPDESASVSSAKKPTTTAQNTTLPALNDDNPSRRRSALLEYHLPFAELLYNFFDQLQQLSHGYASFDYEFHGYRPVDLERIDIQLNNKPCDVFSLITRSDVARQNALKFVQRLGEIIPPALFDIKIQAVAAGSNKTIAQHRIKPYRKDIVAEKILCHGHSGDPQRKQKLLDRQKLGKKRNREISSVSVPPEAFMEMMKL